MVSQLSTFTCTQVQSAAPPASGKQLTYTVRPFEFAAGNWERACTCGGNATSSVMCVHLKKVLRATISRWQQEYVKPWQNTSVWQAQVGTRWEPVDALEQVCPSVCLPASGCTRCT